MWHLLIKKSDAGADFSPGTPFFLSVYSASASSLI
jgi:hypothetical protein